MAASPYVPLKNARCDLTWGRSRLWWEMCGPCSFAVTYRNGLHQHSRYFEICAMISGEGVQTHAGRATELRPGDLFLARPGVLHEIISERDPPIELVFFNLGVVDFDPRDQSVEGRLLKRFLESGLVHSRGGDVVQGMLLSLARSLEERAADQDVMLEMSVRAMVCEVFRRMSSPAAIPQGVDAAAPAQVVKKAATVRAPTGPNRALEQALRFLDDNLQRPISCRELARQAGVSERSLRRLFGEHMGTTPGREYLARRMRWAAHLLNDPQQSVHAVGAIIGIGDPSQFSRDFRRVLGLTPTQYRQTRTTRVTFPEVHAERATGQYWPKTHAHWHAQPNESGN